MGMEFDVSHQDTVDSTSVHATLAVREKHVLLVGCWILALCSAAVFIPFAGMTGYALATVVLQWILPPCTALVVGKIQFPLLHSRTATLIVGAVLVACTGCAATVPGVMHAVAVFPAGMVLWGTVLGSSGMVLWSAVVGKNVGGESTQWMGKVVALVLAGLPVTFAGLLYFVLPHAIAHFPFSDLTPSLRLQDQERAGVLFAFGGKGAIFTAFSILFVQWSRSDAVVMEYRDLPGDDTDDGASDDDPSPTEPPGSTLPAVLIIVTGEQLEEHETVHSGSKTYVE